MYYVYYIIYCSVSSVLYNVRIRFGSYGGKCCFICILLQPSRSINSKSLIVESVFFSPRTSLRLRAITLRENTYRSCGRNSTSPPLKTTVSSSCGATPARSVSAAENRYRLYPRSFTLPNRTCGAPPPPPPPLVLPTTIESENNATEIDDLL